MLTKILSISGKPGLYKLISTGKNINVVESLLDGKRIPVYLTEKVVALSDVSIYTTGEDVPLREVFKKIKDKENGNRSTLGSKSSNKDIFNYFGEILPDFDTEKVYASDVKKIISWYNILIDKNIDFEKVEKKSESEDEIQSSENDTTNNEI